MKIVIGAQLPSKPYMHLLHDHEVVFPTHEIMSQTEFNHNIATADIVLSLVSHDLSQDVMQHASSLKLISNYAVGYNNIDIEYCQKHNITVTNTPNVLTDATANLTMGLLLAITRHIHSAHNFTLQGHFKGWTPSLFLGSGLTNKHLGIIGFGRIGQAVAKRAKAFGLHISYYDPSHKQVQHTYQQYHSLKQLLNNSDIVSIHCPLNEETYHLIDDIALEQMQPHAYLLNTARGSIIHEQALHHHLQKKSIQGAALDVFEYEPEITQGLLALDNILCTPHIGSATVEARTQMAQLATQAIDDFIAGNIPQHVVEPSEDKILTLV